jgi:hypothetical protein
MKDERKRLERENLFKDLDTLVNLSQVSIYITKEKKKGKIKKEIILGLIKKFDITKKEARVAYREFNV